LRLRVGDRWRQIADFDDALVAESDGALQAVFQLANVARPIIGQQGFHGGAGNLEAARGSEAFEEKRGQDGNVGTALPQWRQRNGHDIETEVEVLAEGSLPVFCIEVAVGSGHDTHVDLNLLICYPRDGLLFLEKTQQLGLHFERQFADLVEKNSTGIGRLQQSLLGAESTGKGSFFIAEQLAFDQRGDERSAVDGDEGAAGHGSAEVQRAGHQFLAGSAFAGNQDRGARVFEAGNHAQDVLNAGGIANDAVERSLGF